MDENEQKSADGDNQSSANYAKYTGIVFQMLAIIGLFAFIGYEIDLHLKNNVQWVTALSCIIGVCLSIFQTIRQLKK